MSTNPTEPVSPARPAAFQSNARATQHPAEPVVPVANPCAKNTP